MSKKLVIFLLFGSFFLNHSIYCQVKKFSFSDKTTMQIQGTSTLHDWTCNVTKVEGSIEMDSKILNKGIWSENSRIKSLKVSVPVESIKSPRGAAMEKKLYNALKSDKFPTILFTLSNIKNAAASPGPGKLDANGTLLIAGVEKPISLLVKASFSTDKNLVFEGSYTLNMKDFDVEPPSAMFGQIVSGEKVTISFNAQINKSL